MCTGGRLLGLKHTTHLPTGYTTLFSSLTTAASERVGMSDAIQCQKCYGGTAMASDGNTIFKSILNDTE